MESKYSKASLANSNTVVQSSRLSGFKFSTIGQGPSLLDRMSDSPRVPNRPQSEHFLSQEQHKASHTRSRPTLPQPLVIGSSSVEVGQTAKPIPTQPANTLVSNSTSLSPSDTPSDVKPQPIDSIRASVFPELKYPNTTPDIESPVSWESDIALPQPAPMDQDTPRSQPPDSRNLPPVPVPTRVGPGVVDGAMDNLAASSQNSGSATPIEPEQARRPVEHLFRLASAREERLSKQREIFDLRSGELSTFCAEAVQAVHDLQDKMESLKQQGEEMRAQAEQTLQAANKMREMADSLISSAGTLGVDMLEAKNHVGRAVERSEQLTRFVRKSFDWLATLRGREQEKIALVQAEIAGQELAETVRRQQELQQELERRKIEEQQKKEAAQREEARRKIEEQQKKEAAQREEEQEALRKKAEEENEAARRRAYEMRRAEVMADKWRATQAHAQSIQAERERKTTDASGFSSAPSTRNSDPLLSTSPGPNTDPIHGTEVSKSVTSSQVIVPTPSRSPVARTGEAPEIIPPSQPSPSSNKIKAPALVSFVPARTEAGRAVNTDSPLSSTTLASELHMRNVVEPSQRSRFNQEATRDPAQEQMQPQMPKQAAPTLVPHRVEVKREPSVEVLPAARQQPLSDNVNTDQTHHHQRVVNFSTASHHSMDQHAPISSNFDPRAISSHVAQTEDHNHRSDPSGASSPQNNHPRDYIHDHVAPSMDTQPYRRHDSISSDQSPPRRTYRRPSSPLSLRERRSRSRSPPYQRKRTRSRTPLRFEPRSDHWVAERDRVRPDWDRSRRYNGYDRGRRGDNSHRYRLPPRRNVYKSSHSPPPSSRYYHNDRSPPPRDYRDRTPPAQHVTQRFPNPDAREWRQDEYRPNTNARQYEPTYEEADVRRITEAEEQQRWQQQERQRHSPSPSEHERAPTPPPRQEEVEIGLLDRINMEEAHDRGRGRGRPPPGITRGGPSPRRGIRGGFSSGRGRGGVSGPAPALLSRMENAKRPGRAAPAPSLSDRMEQD